MNTKYWIIGSICMVAIIGFIAYLYYQDQEATQLAEFNSQLASNTSIDNTQLQTNEAGSTGAILGNIFSNIVPKNVTLL